jgi:hypothetical protein
MAEFKAWAYQNMQRHSTTAQTEALSLSSGTRSTFAARWGSGANRGAAAQSVQSEHTATAAA